jgi:hypothetical protein
LWPSQTPGIAKRAPRHQCYGAAMTTEYFAALFKNADGSWSWLPIVLVLAFVALFIYMVWVRRGTNQPRIKGSAPMGTAQVLSLQTSHGGQNMIPLCTVGLRVHIPGHAPYDVTIRRNVHVTQLHWVHPGSIIPVQVDPADPQKIRIDFKPITPPQA